MPVAGCRGGHCQREACARVGWIDGPLYVLAWEIGYQTIASDFIEKYSEHVVTKMKTEGATEAELQEAREANASFGQVYNNPLVRFGFTFLEISWVGLAITLVCAAILRKKEFLPAKETVTPGG